MNLLIPVILSGCLLHSNSAFPKTEATLGLTEAELEHGNQLLATPAKPGSGFFYSNEAVLHSVSSNPKFEISKFTFFKYLPS